MLGFISQKIYAQYIQMKNKKYIHKIKNESGQKTTFIILCAKKSSKRGYKNIPLTSIDKNEKLIDNQIKTILNNYEDPDIIIISGFEHDRLIEHIHKSKYENIRIAENQYHKTTTTLDGWRFGLNLGLNQDTYIIHGDRIFDESCIKQQENQSTHTIIHDIDRNNYNLGISFDDNRLINISYGLPNVWSEIFFISKKDFYTARYLINESKKRKIYNVESFINLLCKEINISILQKQPKDITTLKEL